MPANLETNPSLFRLSEAADISMGVVPFVACNDAAIPEEAQAQFKRWSHSVRLHKLGQGALRLDFAERGGVFVADYAGTSQQGVDFTEVYMADTDTNGNVMGSGIVALIQGDEDLRNTPMVRYTQTEPIYQRRGLGLRRLVIMNEVAKRFFGTALSSSLVSLIQPEAESLWQRLETNGLAATQGERYRFIQ